MAQGLQDDRDVSMQGDPPTDLFHRGGRRRGGDVGRWTFPVQSRARRPAIRTGLDKPDVSDSRETRATCIGRVLIGMKELCRNNGLNEIFTAELVGQLAIDLCDSDPPI